MKTLRQLAAAVQFMTRIPMPAFRFEPEMVLGGAKFFPLIGAVIALGGIGIERGLRWHLPKMVVAVVVLAYLVIITGGFHEDGLADTADALRRRLDQAAHVGDHARQPHRQLWHAGYLVCRCWRAGCCSLPCPWRASRSIC